MNGICQLIILGDSLSDRGTYNKRNLLGVITLSYLSGHSDKSPKGRFTNGYLWGDYICATTAEDFEIQLQRKRLKQKDNARSNADLSDEFLTNKVLRNHNKINFSLNNDKHVLYKGRRFARFYCEGGLTSHDYFYDLSLEPTVETYRLLLSTLEKKREELLADDKKYHISQLEKTETLVIEWSGANDLMTVNNEPTFQEAENAVNERIKNIEQLIQNGYRNFVLFNLPNLALTPRYQAKGKSEQDNAGQCCDYFNEQLAAGCDELNKKYQVLDIPINLSIFDVQAQFTKIYNNPEQYGFEQDKIKTAYIESADFKKNKQNSTFEAKKISPAKGYMFWDDVHPTMTMHNWLAEQFKKEYRTVYNFQTPQQFQKKSTKDDFNCRQNLMRLFDDNSNLAPTVKLPEEVMDILKIMHQNAEKMCKSGHANYHEKGLLLKKFLFELKCQNGNLEKLYEVISKFNVMTNNTEILETHYRPVYDFFTWKTKTRSEDLMNTLAATIKKHLDSPFGSLIN
jgi:phospholipase/lecithinase/hemolysin